MRKKKNAVGMVATLKRFTPYLRSHVPLLILNFSLVLAVAGLQNLLPFLTGIVVDRLTTQAHVLAVFGPLVLFGLALALRAALLLARNQITQQIGMRVTCDMRIQIFEHLQKLSLRFYENRQTGKLVSRITDDAGALYALVSIATVNLAGDLVAIAGIVVVLLWKNIGLALVTFLVMPLFLFNYLWHKRRLRLESRKHRRNWDRVVGFLHERIANNRVVKAFATEQYELDHFRERIEKDYSNYNRVVWRNSILGIGAELLSGIGTLMVLSYGSYLIIYHKDNFTVGDLVAFYIYLTQLYTPVVRIVESNAIFQRALTAIELIFALLDSKPHVPDNDSLPIMPRIQGEVEFRNVTFAYRLGQTTLHDVSFTIRPGEMVALVGPSGGGKSTIVSLLARFYDPSTGSILIDGEDIRKYNVQTLRKQTGIVMQDNILFVGTLAENIKYGRPDATDEEMIAAACAANAHEFISKFSQGYRSEVGERGVQLSGGQRQRIAIARVILKDPRILIFDEATSALDAQSERLVQQATERLMKGRTSLVIAHRLSTIIKADRIVVIEDGRVVEQGTHEELFARKGVYRSLYDLQFAEKKQ